MKNIIIVILCLMLIIGSFVFIGISEATKNRVSVPVETEPEETKEIRWSLDEPAQIVSPDFRNMNWGMNPTETASQEGLSPDGATGEFIFFDNIKFSVFDNARLFYFFKDNACYTAAYSITVRSDEYEYETAENTVTRYLNEMYAYPDESDPFTRTTFSAVIKNSVRKEDDRKIFYIEFSMPEGFLDGYDVLREQK